MRIQFFPAQARPDSHLYEMVGYAEGDSPFPGDRFVVFVNGNDVHVSDFRSYVEQVRDSGADVRGLANPGIDLCDCSGDSVWNVPNAQERGAILILTRFERAAAAIRGKTSWTVFGLSIGEFWSRYAFRVSSFTFEPNGPAHFTAPGQDVSASLDGARVRDVFCYPLWGFSQTKMTIPRPYLPGINVAIEDMVKLDAKDIFGEGLSPEEATALEGFKSDLQTGYMLPSYRLKRDPSYLAYLKLVRHEGMIDGAQSVTDSEFDRRRKIAIRAHQDAMMGASGPH